MFRCDPCHYPQYSRTNLLRGMLLAGAATLQAAEVTVSAPDSPMLRFALGKLEAAHSLRNLLYFERQERP
jgi:hypothetical protein